MLREWRERFPRHRLQRKPLVSDPSMHHGTCVTHVSWCMLGSLTRGGRENVPGIPGACTTRNFTYLARAPIDRQSASQRESSVHWRARPILRANVLRTTPFSPWAGCLILAYFQRTGCICWVCMAKFRKYDFNKILQRYDQSKPLILRFRYFAKY